MTTQPIPFTRRLMNHVILLLLLPMLIVHSPLAPFVAMILPWVLLALVPILFFLALVIGDTIVRCGICYLDRVFPATPLRMACVILLPFVVVLPLAYIYGGK